MTEHPANYLPYHATGYFSRIVTDYLSDAVALRPFYAHTPDLEGMRAAIEARRQFNTPRQVLVQALREQYEGMMLHPALAENIQLLEKDNTFTITTAHQPNIFTGPLYFIYKIIHVIRLAEELNEQLPGNRFVPVYYMGSEDADLEELGHITIGGRKLVWQTSQTGAVGRMKVDRSLRLLIREIYGQTGVLPHGDALNTLLESCYAEGKTIQQATLELVNALFGEYGLVVLVPDNAKLKSVFNPVVEKELLEQFSQKAVASTIEALSQSYKVQAGGRDINLFYLLEDSRERIEKDGNDYVVKAHGLRFTRDEILAELQAHPERFSANVILRGAFQETVLPNIVFVGGGGELAYWLELKEVFAAVNIPYPVLMLRNSFLLLTRQQAERVQKLGFTATDIFHDEQTLLNMLVNRETSHQVSLARELEEAHAFYERLKKLAGEVDASLVEHVASLETRAVQKLATLEKKLLRAEKRLFEKEKEQISALKTTLFPNGSLQERIENFSLYYAREGAAWIQRIHTCSGGFNKGFGVIVS